MFRIILLTLFVATTMCSSEAEEWIKIEPLAESVVKGEPIYFTVDKYNISRRTDYYLDGEKCRVPLRNLVDTVPTTLPDGSPVATGPESKAEMRKSIFPLRNVCDYRIRDMKVGRHEFCYLEGEVKTCCEFEIREPVGIDLEAYNELIDKNCFDFTCNNGKKVNNTLLTRYPTSTYAGWVLVETYSGATFSYWSGKDLIDDLSQTEEERKKKTFGGKLPKDDSTWISPKGKAEYYLSLAEPFIELHPEFAMISVIYARMGLSYLVLHEWHKADRAFDNCLKVGLPSNWDLKYTKLLEETRDELKIRKLIKSNNATKKLIN